MTCQCCRFTIWIIDGRRRNGINIGQEAIKLSWNKGKICDRGLLCEYPQLEAIQELMENLNLLIYHSHYILLHLLLELVNGILDSWLHIVNKCVHVCLQFLHLIQGHYKTSGRWDG